MQSPGLDNLMPLNETDKAWIRETIQSAHKAHGWGAFQRFLKEWSGFGAAIAIIIFAFTQWTAYVEFRTTTTNRLTGIEGQLTKQQIVAHTLLGPSQFTSTLPDLSAAIAEARSKKVNVSPDVVRDIQQKLIASDAASPGYWQAAAQLVSYRSQEAQGWERINLRACSQKDLGFTITANRPIGDGLVESTHGPITFQNCKLILDSAEGQSLISQGLSLADVNFNKCILVYNGGPVVFKPIQYSSFIPALTTAKLNFADCVFLIKFESQPPPSGQRLTAELLAADTNIIRFTPNA